MKGFIVFVITFSHMVCAFDRSDIDFIRVHEIMKTDVALHEDDWAVKPPKTMNFGAYKGQSESFINWDDLDHNQWMNFKTWRAQREKRDTTERWREKVRDLLHRERVANVVQCLNDCKSYNENGMARAQYGSRLLEGMEFATGEDSYAWLYLMDGTIARVSPNSSLSFLEINLSKNKIFFVIRLNQGHVYFQRRQLGEFENQDRAETDLALLPLLKKEANRENFARIEHSMLNDYMKNVYTMENNPGHTLQYDKLNELLDENKNTYSKVETEILFYTANTSLSLINANFHAYYATLGTAILKVEDEVAGLNSTDPRKTSARLAFRGYTNRKIEKLELNQWYSVDPEGKEVEQISEPEPMKAIKHFVKRIPSIQLAREFFIREKGEFLLQDWLKKDLAVKYGYRLWDNEKELNSRKEYLVEYIRRTETTNLFSMQKVYDEIPPSGLGPEMYREALATTLWKLKQSHSLEREILKEANETEYYLWIVKNAKEFLPTYIR